jgi:hypothetical protein
MGPGIVDAVARLLVRVLIEEKIGIVKQVLEDQDAVKASVD